MSIIYSYPESQPTLQDLLIGTDVADENATKSFSVQSLVSLINAESGSGTVTDVDIINTDGFLYPKKDSDSPVVAWNINLTNNGGGGSPSDTDFYRGDGRWAVPVLSGISVLDQSASITTDVSQFNFTGAGVTASSDSSGNVNVTIAGATNAVEQIIASTGISLSGPTGDVVITNTGITSLVQGGGISISTNESGQATLTVPTQTSGTVTSVGAGAGLVETGTTSIDPIISLEYNTNTSYVTQPETIVPVAADFVPFHSVSGSKVGKVTFGDIQASTLALVQTAITDTENNSVENDTDTFTSVPVVDNVVTLLDTDYTNLAVKDPRTLYFTVATAVAPTTGTVQFAVVDTGISTNDGCGFNVTTTCSPAFTDGTNLTNVAIGTNYTLTSTITPINAGCQFSGTNPQVVTGSVVAGTTPITQNLTGSISIPATPQGGNTLNVNTAISGGTAGVEYTVSPTSGSSTGDLGTSVGSYGVTASIANTAQYELTAGSLTAVQSSAVYANPNSTSNASFPSTTIGIRDYDLDYTVTPSGGLSSGYNSTWALSTSGSFTANPAALTGSLTQQYNGNPTGYTFNAQAVGINGNTVSGSSWSGQTGGAFTGDTSITGNLSGSVTSATGSVRMDQNLITSGPGASTVTPVYTFDGAGGYQASEVKTGTIGATANFGASFTYDTNNYWIDSSSVNITPTSAPQYTSSITVVTANITVSTQPKHAFQSLIAGIPGSGGSGGSACQTTEIPVTVFTDTSAAAGLSVGQTVYASATSNTPYATNASAWWKTGAPGGNQIVNFDSSGTVANIASC